MPLTVPGTPDQTPDPKPVTTEPDQRIRDSIAPSLDAHKVDSSDQRIADSIMPFVNARSAALKASLQNAVETDADKHAKILQIADKIGVPSSFVEEDPQMFQAKSRYSQMDADALERRHPELAKWLSNPDNSKVAQDDLHVLQTMDNAIRSITDPKADPTGILPSGYTFTADGGIAGPPKFGQSEYFQNVADLRKSLEVRGESQAIGEMEAKKFFQDKLNGSHFLLGLVSPLAGYSKDSASDLQALEEESQREAPGIWGDAQRFAGSLVGGIPMLMAGGALTEAATALSKGASLRAFMQPSTSTLGKFGQKVVTAVANPETNAIQRGVQGALLAQPFALSAAAKDAQLHGGGNGAMNWLIQTAIPGAMGPGPIARAFVPGAAAQAAAYEGVAMRLLKDFGFQGTQNAAIALASAIHARVSGTDPDALDPAKLIPSLGSTFALGGATGALFGLGPAFHEQVVREANDARVAVSFADRMAMAVDQLKQSTTAERSPERIQQLVGELTAGRSVFLQSDHFSEIAKAQGVDPHTLAQEMGISQAYQEAQAHGGDVQLPMDAALELARKMDDPSPLLMKVKQEPGAPTAETGMAFFETKVEETASVLKEAKKIADDAEATLDPEAQKVYEDVYRQRIDNGAGEVRAQYEARLMAAYQEVKARRLGEKSGETAWTLYQQSGLKIHQETPGVTNGERSLVLYRGAKGETALNPDAGDNPGIWLTSVRANAEKFGDVVGYTLKPGAKVGTLQDLADARVAVAKTGVEAGSEAFNKAVRDELSKQGIAVINDQKFKGAGGNGKEVFAVFDPSLLEPAKTEAAQTVLKQSSKDIERGSIAFGPKENRDYTINLTPEQNLSTTLHEFGHFFLQDFGDFAERADAPEGVKADMATILDWLGVKDRSEIGKPEHERFADAFLNYLKEGKAPSTGLRAAFVRFRSWLGRLFTSGQIQTVRLNDDVRAVFDRMLATDEEIKIAEEANGVTALFLDAEQAGKTPAEWAAYQKGIEAAHVEAVENLQTQMVDDLEREQRAWYKEEKAKVRAKIDADVNARPAYKALLELQDGEAGLKLSKADIEAIYGEGAKAKLAHLPGPGKGRNNRGKHIISTDGGITVQAAADLFGFKTGDELINALIEAPNRQKQIEAETVEEMKRLHGDILTDGTLHEKAIAAVQNDERGKVLMSELKALRKLERQAAPAVKAALDEQSDVFKNATEEERAAMRAEAKARRDQERAGFADIEDSIPSQEVLRITAERVISSKKIRDLAPEVYQQAARKASAEAMAALKQKDYKAAAEAKQRELLSFELHKAALAARAGAEKAFRYLKRFDQSATREKVGKAGGWEWTVTKPDGSTQAVGSEQEARTLAKAIDGATWERTSGYLEQIDAILNRFEFRKITLKNAKRRESLAKWIESQRALGADVVIPEFVADELNKTNYREMTIDQITGVHDAVKNIETLAKNKNKLSKLAKDRALAETVGELAATAVENARKKLATPFSKSRTERGFSFFSHVDANLTKLSALARRMDGEKDGGAWWQTIVHPLNEADAKRAEMRHQDSLALNEARKEWGKGREVYTVKFDPILKNRISHMGKIMMALNWGAAENRERLLNGGKRPLTEEQVHAVLDSLDEKDWAYVRSIWKIIGKYASEIKAQEQRLTGVAPEMVEPVPVVTKYGTFEGSYFPIKYDGELSASGKTSDISTDGGNFAAMFTAPHTRNGFVKERVAHTGKDLLLDERVITQHLNEVTHRLTHEDTFQDLGKILRSKEVQDAIIDHYGIDAFNIYRETIANIAQGDAAPQKGIEQGIHYLRVGTSLSVMAYNIMSAIHQIPGMTQSIVRVGPKWFALGLKRFLGDAAKMESTAQWIASKSLMMKNRATNFRPETNERLDKTAFATLAGPVRDHAYYLMQKMQLAVDIPTWIAGYEKALSEGRTEAEAAGLGDQAVLDTQGSGSIKDLSKYQRMGEWAKLFNVFGHFFSTTYQLTRGSYNRTNFRDVGSVGHFLADMVLLYTAPILMTAALDKAVQAVIGGPDQKPSKKADGVLEWLAKQHASYAMNMIPGVRELAGTIAGGYGYSGTAGTRGFAELSNLIQQFGQGKADHGLARAIVGSSGILFHLPATQVNRIIDGILSLSEGKSSPAAILFGPPKK